MPAGQEPQAVPVGPAGAVEPEELPPAGEPGDGERHVHGEPRRGGRPPQEDRAIGLASAEPIGGERDEQQTGEELGGRPQTDQRTRPPVAAAEERQHPRRGERDGEEVPVHEGLQRQARGEREPERAARIDLVEARGGDGRAHRQQDRVHPEEAAGVVPRDPARGPQEVHREHGVLVAVVVRGHARVEVGEAAAGELLGGEERHDVRVAGEVVLTAVGPVPSGARALLDRADQQRPAEAHQHEPEGDRPGGAALHTAHRIGEGHAARAWRERRMTV